MADNIDSRDLVKELEEYEYEWENDRPTDPTAQKELFDGVCELRDLMAKLRGYCEEEPEDGITLIPANQFVEYVQELIDECYGKPEITNSSDWPWRHMTMDWKAAAEDLEDDYHEVTFRGVDYLCR